MKSWLRLECQRELIKLLHHDGAMEKRPQYADVFDPVESLDNGWRDSRKTSLKNFHNRKTSLS